MANRARLHAVHLTACAVLTDKSPANIPWNGFQGEDAVHDAIRQQQLAVGATGRILAGLHEWGARNEEVVIQIQFAMSSSEWPSKSRWWLVQYSVFEELGGGWGGGSVIAVLALEITTGYWKVFWGAGRG